MGSKAYVNVSYNPVMEISNPVNVDLTPVKEVISEIKDESKLSQANFSALSDKFLSALESIKTDTKDNEADIKKYAIYMIPAFLLFVLFKK